MYESTSAQRVTKVTGRGKKEPKRRVRKDEEAWGGWIRVCLTCLISCLSKLSPQIQTDHLFYSAFREAERKRGRGGWRVLLEE